MKLGTDILTAVVASGSYIAADAATGPVVEWTGLLEKFGITVLMLGFFAFRDYRRYNADRERDKRLERKIDELNEKILESYEGTLADAVDQIKAGRRTHRDLIDHFKHHPLTHDAMVRRAAEVADTDRIRKGG